MAISNVNFMGTPYASAPRYYQPAFQQQSQQVENQQPQEKKNNNSTYFAAAAVIGLTTLAILGHKGYLGEKIQKFLGGAEKATSKSSSATESVASKTETTTAGSASKTESAVGEAAEGTAAKAENIVVRSMEEANIEAAKLKPGESKILEMIDEDGSKEIFSLKCVNAGEVECFQNSVRESSLFFNKDGKLIKMHGYCSDGKTLGGVVEYSAETGFPIKTTGYQSDGKTIQEINEFYDGTDKLRKSVTYHKDGKIIKEVTECYESGMPKIMRTCDERGRLTEFFEFDANTGNPTRGIKREKNKDFDGYLEMTFDGKRYMIQPLEQKYYDLDNKLVKHLKLNPETKKYEEVPVSLGFCPEVLTTNVENSLGQLGECEPPKFDWSPLTEML